MSFLFREKPLIFVHIPKTGGVSIRTWAFDRGLARRKIESGGKHVSANKLIKKWKAIDPNLQTFAVVRNPYDRVVSCWKYYTDKEKTKFSFEEFVFAEKLEPVKKKTDPLYKIQKYKIGLIDSVVRDPMVNYVNDDTIILRYENLNEDFKTIQQMVNQHDPLPMLNTSSKDKGYKQYYNDATREHIRELYKEDFERFNYDF